MKTLKIGIADYDQMKARTLAIARGEHTPASGEPRVWFTSIESFARLLSEHNRHLARERPRSLTEIAELAGRSKSNLSANPEDDVAIRTRGIAARRAWQTGARVPYDQVRLDVPLTGIGVVGRSASAREPGLLALVESRAHRIIGDY